MYGDQLVWLIESCLLPRRARIVSTADENESIIYGFVDVDEINKSRRGLPISVQRRFDVYPDISDKF